MAYMSLGGSSPKNFRIRKDLVRTAAVRDFEYHTRLKLYDMPDKLARPVLRTQQAVFDRTTLIGRYRLLTVSDVILSDETGEAGVIVENDHFLTGSYPDAAPGGKVLFLIVTLQGLREIAEEISRMSDSYYLEVWGRVFIEQGIAYFRHELRRALKRSGYQPSAFLFPGMKTCRLSNQREIFRILEPEDLGVTLSPGCIMSPEKSFTCFTFARNKDL